MAASLIPDRYIACYDEPARHIRGLLTVEAVAETGAPGSVVSLKGLPLNF